MAWECMKKWKSWRILQKWLIWSWNIRLSSPKTKTKKLKAWWGTGTGASASNRGWNQTYCTRVNLKTEWAHIKITNKSTHWLSGVVPCKMQLVDVMVMEMLHTEKEIWQHPNHQGKHMILTFYSFAKNPMSNTLRDRIFALWHSSAYGLQFDM